MKKPFSKLVKCIDVEFSESVKSRLSIDEQRRIRLVNYLCILSIFTMMSYVVIYIIWDFQVFRHAIVFLSGGSILLVGVVIVNKLGRHRAAKIILSVLMPVLMSYISIVVFGSAPGFQVYLFVSLIIIILLWPFVQLKNVLLLIASILIVFAYIEFFPPLIEPKSVLPEKYIYIFRLTNVFICFLATSIAIVIYQLLYQKKEEQLTSQAEELRLSQAHKDIVYSIIAHDLRGPFGFFSGLTELIAEKYSSYSDEERIEMIKSMNKSAVSLQNLLENLLDWSRTQSGSLQKNMQNFKLVDIVEESLVLHQELIQEKMLEVELDIDSWLKIYVDHHMISTVFRNLISNAIKFTSQKGRIAITAKKLDSKIQVFIQDSGVGLSEREIRNLFDISSEDRLSGKSSEKGSGLGLLLCKDFIENHNGEIWVESEIGKGSRFYFTLPVGE